MTLLFVQGKDGTKKGVRSHLVEFGNVTLAPFNSKLFHVMLLQLVEFRKNTRQEVTPINMDIVFIPILFDLMAEDKLIAWDGPVGAELPRENLRIAPWITPGYKGAVAHGELTLVEMTR